MSLRRRLSAMMYRATRIRLAPVKNVLIWWFARHYQVNLSEARWPDLRHYPDFNSFFTRPLLPDARPVWSVPGSLCSPCDGVVSERRNLRGEWLVEAKGAAFSASDLLADPALARHLDGGDFLTIYLSPRDYHRVHVPCPSRLTTIRFIPGKLFSVRPRTVAAVPGLLARNERAVFELEADFGRYALVMVGALFVSSIETSLTGTLSAEGDAPQSFTFTKPHGFSMGEELATFNMGSTVILLLPKDAIRWHGADPGTRLQFGTRIGEVAAPRSSQ